MDPAESTESANGESKGAGPIESPFKLLKVKGNNTLPTLGLSPASNVSPNSANPSTEAALLLSPTSPISPTFHTISLNPFSLSKLKKSTSNPPVNGTAIPRISPLAGIGKEIPLEQQIVDLQNEVSCLKNEIESKDAKLSSSMRSIKMFWSPELKKERASHKEDVERMMLLKSQCDSVQAEIKKNAAKIKELEDELELERTKNIVSTDTFSKAAQEDAQELSKAAQEISRVSKEDIEKLEKLNEELKNDMQIFKEKLEDSQRQIELRILELETKDTLINALKSDLEELRLKENEHIAEHENVTLAAAEVSGLQEDLKQKEVELHKVFKTVTDLEEQNAQNAETIRIKDTLLEEAKQRELQLEDEKELLVRSSEETEEKCKSLLDEITKMNEEIEAFKQQVNQLEIEVESIKKEYESLQSLQGETTVKNQELLTKLEESKGQVESKEQEISSLNSEISKMKVIIEEKEKAIKDKEESMDKIKLSRRRESVETQDLRSVVEGKDREIESLTKKFETLDTYLSHRETALSHARDELTEIKSKHANCEKTTSFMESQIADKDQLITRLEKQRNRLEKEKEDEVGNANNARTKNEAKIKTLDKQLEEKEEWIKELEDKIEKLQDDLEKKKKIIKSNTELSDEKDKKIDSLSEELSKAKEDLEKLEKSLNDKKNAEENNRNSLKIPDDIQKRYSASSPVKDNKVIKQLWDEIAKKDSRLQDLEKQLKDKGKQLSSLRKTQNLERQTQFLTDKSIKKEDNGVQQSTEIKEELAKKDDRIAMLEDALRESVSIAAEREELLAQNVEFSESAALTIQQLEADKDRLTMEKGITNIKNSFLILSLGERDSLLAALKSMRKRSLDELMNIKQTALLAAISEKDSNIALLELQSSSKGRKQEIKQCKLEKDKLVNELKEQTQQRITITNNEENKDGFLYKELEDAPNELVLQSLRNLTDSSDKLEYYIDALMSFVKERNLEILKEMPTLQKRSAKSLDKLRNASKSQLLRELQRCEEDCSQLKSFVDILLEKLEG